MIVINGLPYYKSTRRDKKLYTIVNGKKVHFGNNKYQHYFDKTGIWQHLDHLDDKRRLSFIKRFSGIKLKTGKLAINDVNQPAYHALRILW